MGHLWLCCVLALCAAAASTASTSPFGHKLLPSFMMAQGLVNLNHGSYGATPKVVFDNETASEREMESSPDLWFRYEVYERVDWVRAAIAKYIGAEASDVAFVENASHGINAVLRSLRLGSNKKILFLNIAYQMVKNTLSYVNGLGQEQLLQVNVTFPTSPAAIVSLVVDALDKNKGQVALASFSHISSTPGIILPVADLTAACHERGVMVMIDGAHAMGQIPVNVTELNADFYITNGHKWLYSPKGSALLWVRRDRQPLVVPVVISDEGQGATPFQKLFSYQGTLDYSAFLAMARALEFRESLGDKAIMSYMHSLAVQGGDVLASAWGTDVLVSSSMIGAMVNVRLPTTNDTLALGLPKALLEQYDTWVPAFKVQGVWYTRVCAQIYVEISDFHYLAKSVLALLGKGH